MDFREYMGLDKVSKTSKFISEASKTDEPSDLVKDIFDNFKDSKFELKDFNKVSKTKASASDFKELQKSGALEKSGKTFSLSPETLESLGFTGLTANTKKSNAKGSVDDAVKKKAKKLKIPAGARGDTFDKFFREVLQNMVAVVKRPTTERLLLTGKPGTGKTSAINQLSILFGMHLITIEGAHVSEEDIINIPYVITTGDKKTNETAEFTNTGSGYEIVNAKSSLVSKLDSLSFIKDAEYQKMLNQNKLLLSIYNKYKTYIDSVRRTAKHKSGFKAILFIDEYFRTSDKKITNLLRTILNGQIGDTDIPDDTYLIFASNMGLSDGSLDEIPLNQQFTSVNFDTPSVADFANYLADKYTDYDASTGEEDESKKIRGSDKINTDVFNAFMENITKEDMSEENNGVRISSRRMEQIILYVNSKVPLETQEEANALMNYITINFTNANENTVSSLVSKYKTIVKKIIADTSPNIDVKAIKELPVTDWDVIVEQEIEAKIEIGKDRTYPLVLSGLPGTGKTSAIRGIAEKKGLGLITIDASTLTLDSVNGIPVPEVTGKKIETKFTAPPLYKKIMDQYNAQKKFIEEGRKYNFILFIDEFSRTESIAIQNKIRMLLLEGKVNSSYPIPEDIMIMGAMNPTDDAGSTQETADHVLDVLDVVPVQLSFDDLNTYLKEDGLTFKDEKANLKFDITRLSYELVNSLALRFKSPTNTDGVKLPANVQPYWWSIGEYNVIYVSPREITSMFEGLISRINFNFSLDGWNDIDNFNEEVFNTFIDTAKYYVYEKMKGTIDFICDKQQVEDADKQKFLKIINTVIQNSSSFDIIKKIKSEAVQMQSFSSLFDAVDYSLKEILANNGQVVVQNYLNTIEDYTMAAADIGDLLNSVTEKGSAFLYIFLGDFIKFLHAIDWSSIKAGTADQIKVVFQEKIKALTYSDFFLNELLTKSDEEMEEFTTAVESLSSL